MIRVWVIEDKSVGTEFLFRLTVVTVVIEITLDFVWVETVFLRTFEVLSKHWNNKQSTIVLRMYYEIIQTERDTGSAISAPYKNDCTYAILCTFYLLFVSRHFLPCLHFRQAPEKLQSHMSSIIMCWVSGIFWKANRSTPSSQMRKFCSTSHIGSCQILNTTESMFWILFLEWIADLLRTIHWRNVSGFSKPTPVSSMFSSPSHILLTNNAEGRAPATVRL